MNTLTKAVCAVAFAGAALPCFAHDTEMLRYEHGWRMEESRVSYFDSHPHWWHCRHHHKYHHHGKCYEKEMRSADKERGGLNDRSFGSSNGAGSSSGGSVGGIR